MKAFGKICLGVGLISFGLGLCLLIIAGVSGLTLRKEATNTFAQGYEQEISSLDFEIDYGHVKFLLGDEFSVDAEGLFEDGSFESEVKNGVWTIRNVNSDRVNVFGWRVPVITIFGDRYEPDIVITIPKDFVAEDIKLNLGAARLEADRLRSNTGSFKLGAGEANIEQLEVTKRSSFEVGAGSMRLDRVDIRNITVDCGVGYISLEGRITGENEITCGVGEVRMALEGDFEAYSYDIQTGIGNVTVNGKKFFGSVDRNARKEALGSFEMENGIGNITLDIYE